MQRRVITGSVQAQIRMTTRQIEDLMPLITMPMFTLVFMSIVDFLGRRDLTGYAVVAPLLLTIGQMGIRVAGDMVTRERNFQTLELIIATPAPFVLIAFVRILLLSSLSLLGFVESWLLAHLIFDASITVHHPWLMAATLVLTVAAASGVALIAAALLTFTRSNRNVQNSAMYPLFLISGVLAPVSVLPDWLEPLSRISFLYWSANLMRDSLVAGEPSDVGMRLLAITALGAVFGLLGALILDRMLHHLKREGTLGLA